MKIYLDACCLNCPFDDQSQDRVRLEAEAVLLIIKHFENNEWSWFSSDILDYELAQIPDSERLQRVRLLTRYVHILIEFDEEIVTRAKQFENLGFKAYDALHIACAEKGNVDILLTTDDRFLRLANRFSDQLKIKLGNPLVWLSEVMEE